MTGFDMSAPKTIGFIGLGQMGQAMASHIAKGPAPLFCYDLIPGRAPDGAVELASMAEVIAKAETTFLSLTDGAVVNAVAAEIAAMEDVAGKAVVDMSTIGPDAARQAAATLGAAGVAYIDAPVSGGRAGALKAAIAVIWGGPKAEMERHRPIIDLFCANAFHVGDDPGQGQAVKLLNNFLTATSMSASTEAVLFGLHHGIDMKTILDVVKVSTGNNTAISDKFPNRILTRSFDAGFFAELMSKDVQLYRRCVEEAGTPGQIGAEVADVWRQVDEALPPHSDFTRIFEVLEKKVRR